MIFMFNKLRKFIKRRKVKHLPPSLISLDSNPIPVGAYKTFVSGAAINAGNVVSLHTDGYIYPSSSTYPNIVGIAIDSASASGQNVRVIVLGVAQAVSDGAINPGSPVTFSTATAGRVVSYGGHSHSVSLSTATAVTGVSTSTTSVISSVSTSTGTFVTGISVDKRNFTTASAITGVSKTTTNYISSIGNDTGWGVDASGYARHTHSIGIGVGLADISTSTGTFVTGITSTAGTTIVAGVSASTSSAVTGISTGSATVVSGVGASTGTFVTGVSLGTTLSRILGIALTGASAAGQTINVLVIPSRV